MERYCLEVLLRFGLLDFHCWEVNIIGKMKLIFDILLWMQLIFKFIFYEILLFFVSVIVNSHIIAPIEHLVTLWMQLLTLVDEFPQLMLNLTDVVILRITDAESLLGDRPLTSEGIVQGCGTVLTDAEAGKSTGWRQLGRHWLHVVREGGRRILVAL